tara:strand:- start:10389 stop:10892 length:504 start_codon:yes stop_codon:yes gene_type:complete
LVPGRGADRPEEQDHATLGETRHAPVGASRPADPLRLYLWRHLPGRGVGAALVLPRCNTEAMTLHLKEIAAVVKPNAHAIIIVDQAGWHFSKALEVPGNITLVPLPPRSPELNPTENIWQFMRDNWLSNRVFKSYSDIIDHCCFAWNQLCDQPWKIMSIGLRKWAHQ